METTKLLLSQFPTLMFLSSFCINNYVEIRERLAVHGLVPPY